MKNSKVRWASLISGGATTTAAMLRALGTHPDLSHVEPAVVIADNHEAGSALSEVPNSPPLVVVPRADFPKGASGREPFGEAVLKVLREYGTDIVTQNGWESYTHPNVIDAFPRIINQHPDDPRHFGGSKMCGIVVVCARLQFCRAVGRSMFVIPVAHWVTPILDGGAIVGLGRVKIDPSDDCESLYGRVKVAEREVQIQALADLANDRASEVTIGSSVFPGEQRKLDEARAAAVAHHRHN